MTVGLQIAFWKHDLAAVHGGSEDIEVDTAENWGIGIVVVALAFLSDFILEKSILKEVFDELFLGWDVGDSLVELFDDFCYKIKDL